MMGEVIATSSTTLKQRLTFLTPSFSMMEILDATKVADVVVLVLNVAGGEEAAIGEVGGGGGGSSDSSNSSSSGAGGVGFSAFFGM